MVGGNLWEYSLVKDLSKDLLGHLIWGINYQDMQMGYKLLGYANGV